MNILAKIGRIEVISPRQRKKLIWKACELLKFKDKPFEVDFFGMKYRGHTRNHIDRYVYFLGGYEKGMLAFIRQTLESSKDKVFIDIGANIGHHTLFASKLSNKVFSFEPYVKVRELLEQKIQDNNIQNVIVVPYGLGDKDQELPFFEPPDSNTGTGSFLHDDRGQNLNNGLKLIVKNATTLFEELGIQTASLIKIDVEGFEAYVLKGLLPFLEKNKPMIVMEYTPESEQLYKEQPEVREYLQKNYQMARFDNPNKVNYKLLPWNFDKYGDIVLTPL